MCVCMCVYIFISSIYNFIIPSCFYFTSTYFCAISYPPLCNGNVFFFYQFDNIKMLILKNCHMLYYFHFFEVQFSLLLNLWAFIYWVWFLCQVLNSDFQVSSEARGFLLSSDSILVLGGLAVAFLWILVQFKTMSYVDLGILYI